MSTFAIILAAGSSKRMGKDKIFLEINGKTLIEYVLNTFEGCKKIDEMIIAAKKDKIIDIQNLISKNSLKKVSAVVEGGKERQDSVFNAIKSIKNAGKDDLIAVHNAANIFVSASEIERCVLEAKKHGASAAGFPLKDTIKKASKGFVEKTIDRSGIWQMQTPQCAKYGLLMEGFQFANSRKLSVTDEASLIEAIGRKVRLVECSSMNFKITTKHDFMHAKEILGKTHRIGNGEDHHWFDSKKKLVLGGALIPDSEGLDANSDGDIILHCAFNAVSSAISGRSLGVYADKMFKKGIKDSKEYIGFVLGKMKKSGYEIENISFSIEAKKPRLEQHHEKIILSLSKILGLDSDRIGLTFTSGDDMTEFGRGKGMKCTSIALLRKK